MSLVPSFCEASPILTYLLFEQRPRNFPVDAASNWITPQRVAVGPAERTISPDIDPPPKTDEPEGIADGEGVSPIWAPPPSTLGHDH